MEEHCAIDVYSTSTGKKCEATKSTYSFAEMAQVSQSLWKVKETQDAEKPIDWVCIHLERGTRAMIMELPAIAFCFETCSDRFFRDNESVENHDAFLREQWSTTPHATTSGH